MMWVVNAPSDGLARLRGLADGGGLDPICERHGIAVLTVFGSTARREPNPRDLDIAVLLRPGRRPDYLPLIDDLQRASGTDIDLVVLNNADVILRERALAEAVPLYEVVPGAWIRAATTAVLERMDTAWMRRLELDLLAG